MSKRSRSLLLACMTALVILAATPAFARGISFKDAGPVLWIFIIIGAGIILLQLIPAAILFFSFVGTTSSLAFRKRTAPEEVGAAEEDHALADFGQAAEKK